MGRKLEIESSVVYEKIVDAKTRNIVLEGGARSSKTVAILQYFITDAFASKIKKDYDIVRETLPALKATALKDFIWLLNKYELFKEDNFNRSELIYNLRGHTFNFYSTDDEKKLRGRKRHKILLNEPNEMPWDVYKQVDLRTLEQIIMDYNPSQEEHWIYDHIIPRKNCTFIHSTYKDNPFLEQNIIESIEAYEKDDPDTWKIFGLGLRGKRIGLIFQNWDIVPSFPEKCSDILYGMDFGFNDPKVLVKLGRLGNDIYIEELIYESRMFRKDYIQRMKELIPEDQWTTEQYADSEDPESIEEISSEGFNIFPADKGKGSVVASIESTKSYHLHITAGSVNTIKDFQNWKWKRDKNDKPLDKPIHAFSHAPAAVRYPIHTHWGKEYLQVTKETLRNADMVELESVKDFENY